MPPAAAQRSDVKFLLGRYGLTDRDEAWNVLLTLARESRTRGWWHQYGDAVPDWFEVFVGRPGRPARFRTPALLI